MSQSAAEGPFFRKTLLAAVTVLALVLLTLLIGYVVEILLVILAGTILGLYLQTASRWASRRTRLPRLMCLFAIFLLAGGLLVGLGFLLAPQVATEFRNLGAELNRALKALEEYLVGTPIGQEFLQRAREALGTGEDGEVKPISPQVWEWAGNVLGIFSSALGFFLGVLLIIMVSLYVSVEPNLYRNGMLRLLPPKHRERAAEVMARLQYVLSWWFVGQLISMAVLGTTVTIFLLIMDVPLAFLLGLITAVMTFIPNLGPVLAGIPTVVMALAVSPTTALVTLLFVIAIQNIEGWFLTPIVHRRLIAMPPALIIGTQLILASLVGVLGVFLAMPLVAVGMVLVRMLYIEDFLGDHSREVELLPGGTTQEGGGAPPPPSH